MLGFKFIKVQPTDFVLQYRRGKLVREGTGLSFLYFSATTSLVLVPVGSVDVPFIFEEVTADFQAVTVQGQITYRVKDPKKLSQLMNFTLSSDGKSYSSDDPKQVTQRLISHMQVITRSSLKGVPLHEALGRSNDLVASLHEELRNSESITTLGIEILGVSILAIKPTPETARALEAEAREQLLREADEAVYARRNAAVQQERAIKENELNTEIAVENKKRQIREAQMAAQIAIEDQNKQLVALSTANAREEADAKAYAVSSVMKALAHTDPKTLQALTCIGMDTGQLIALAFRDLADGADKIGQLNITPDLLRELITKPSKK